jgi:hypothetical protein
MPCRTDQPEPERDQTRKFCATNPKLVHTAAELRELIDIQGMACQEPELAPNIMTFSAKQGVQAGAKVRWRTWQP